ncbi:hypothetical protein ABIC89_000395 [Variovorax boronicumulans]|uniref:hypothetical protein n=1 Tax=Variovorax boronicumulans TaxID=436515 RepID=UPI003392B9C1
MTKLTTHFATITLTLPYDMDAGAENLALLASGIPVDSLGNAKSGFLFVRTTGNWEDRSNTFRWFASRV